MKKSKVLLLLMLISLLLGVISACGKEVIEDNIEIRSHETLDEEVVIENEDLELRFDPSTTQFSIVQKNTGFTWYSNPPNAETDTSAQATALDVLMSTITIRYNTESGSATSMNNYKLSIKEGYYNYEKIDNGIKVNYSIGNIDEEYMIPIAVPESRFLEFFDEMSKSSQNMVVNNYTVIDIDEISGDEREEAIFNYPDIEEEKRIRVLRDSTQEYMKEMMEEFFKEVGYTREDYEEDKERYPITSESDNPIFNISIIYELDGPDFIVSVPLDEIGYKYTHPIVELRILPYFGAGGAEDEGFLFVPDGAGGIINFNNGKTTQRTYRTDIYGWDYGRSRSAIIDESRINFPVFGISKTDAATNQSASFICTMEEGSSYGFIEADIGGKASQYNYVAANYIMVQDAMMDISIKSDRTVRHFQESLPDGVISQRYTFLDDTDYTSMAVTYREYLVNKYPDLAKQMESEVPVAVEIIGAVDRTKHYLGIPFRKPYELTSYEEALAMTEELLSFGIEDLNIKYNGWFNDGVLHKAPNKVKLISDLGTKKDFNNLVEFTDENGVNLYLTSTFQFLYNNTLFDNYINIRDTAKFVSRKSIELEPFSPIWFGRIENLYTYHLTKPAYYLENIRSYANEIEELGVKNIAFEDIGSILSGDYNHKDEVSREEALKKQSDVLSELDENDYGMMFNNVNEYALPYADIVVDMSLATKGYNIIDEEIPFFPIALHGIVKYAGEPLNLAQDFERSFLKTVETGAGLFFIYMDADAFDLQDSRYTEYFSSDFSIWADRTNELYNTMNEDFGHLYDQYIVDHQILAKGVAMTEYEDGTQVIVNYNEFAYTYNGKDVPGKDYIVEGGKQ